MLSGVEKSGRLVVFLEGCERCWSIQDSRRVVEVVGGLVIQMSNGIL